MPTNIAKKMERLRKSLAWTIRELDRSHGAHAFDLRRDAAEFEAEIRDLEHQASAEADAMRDTAPAELTSDDIDALAARDAERQERNRIEGRILVARTPAHTNSHD